LHGLEPITLPSGISHFDLEVVFSQRWQDGYTAIYSVDAVTGSHHSVLPRD